MSAGKTVWEPSNQFANVIIDDPLLRSRYGFLDLVRLVAHLADLGAAATIGFIPWKYRRNSAQGIELVRAHHPRLSFAIHGTDHTRAEFALSSIAEAAKTIAVGAERVTALTRQTGLHCDQVMIFPQGIFSAVSIRALRHSGLLAAVNTELVDRDVDHGVSVVELRRPAINCYSGFLQFLRRKPSEPAANFAVDLFLGKPCLVVTHHDFFSEGFGAFDYLVSGLQSLEPQLIWTNLEDIVTQTSRTRHTTPGTLQVEVFTCSATSPRPAAGIDCIAFRMAELPGRAYHVTVDGVSCPASWDTDHLTVVVPSGGHPRTLAVACPLGIELHPTRRSLYYRIQTASRRNLSEVRDNYVMPLRRAVRRWTSPVHRDGSHPRPIA